MGRQGAHRACMQHPEVCREGLQVGKGYCQAARGAMQGACKARIILTEPLARLWQMHGGGVHVRREVLPVGHRWLEHLAIEVRYWCAPACQGCAVHREALLE